MTNRLIFFIALFATALALGPALAHAFELPNKLGLSRDDYFTVQQIYGGWDRLAFVLVVEIAAMIALAILTRGQPAMPWTIAAILSVVAAQALFWLLTYPANVATANWTTVPANWADLRRQWEYSHLAGALCQLGAMACLIVAALHRQR